MGMLYFWDGQVSVLNFLGELKFFGKYKFCGDSNLRRSNIPGGFIFWEIKTLGKSNFRGGQSLGDAKILGRSNFGEAKISRRFG